MGDTCLSGFRKSRWLGCEQERDSKKEQGVILYSRETFQCVQMDFSLCAHMKCSYTDFSDVAPSEMCLDHMCATLTVELIHGAVVSTWRK